MNVDKCPHCGNDQEFYSKDYAYGNVRSFSRFDGGEPDNSELHGNLRYKMGKWLYCGECHKKIVEVQG